MKHPSPGCERRRIDVSHLLSIDTSLYIFPAHPSVAAKQHALKGEGASAAFATTSLSLNQGFDQEQRESSELSYRLEILP
ncbi:hypothetical protein TNCV_4068371 [Trichonephila clavipes]|nr:hypothetical protein TNCV_4068371 [Trichonephila clavipes]